MTDVAKEPPAYFMRGAEVERFTGLKPAARDKAIRAGLFPRPFRIGVRAKAWKREEVVRWREQRDLDRDHYVDPAVPNPLTDEQKVARYEAAHCGAV